MKAFVRGWAAVASLLGGAAMAAPPLPVPPLAARFVWMQAVGSASQPEAAARSPWFFVRDDDRVESIRPDEGVAEIWRRGEGGHIDYEQVYAGLKRIVEYSWGELEALHRTPDWALVSTFVAPGLLDKLEQVGSVEVLGRTALRYTGTIGDVWLEIDWLPELVLPARLLRRDATGSSVLELQELAARRPPAWVAAEPAAQAAYERIDAADFGDREQDPVVRALMARQGRQHAH